MIFTDLKIERRETAQLIPYARNSRTHSDAQVAQIAASMREWGWTNPILIDEEGMIIAGHGRVQAAQLLEILEVPVIVAAGWTEAQKKAYVIADNKLAMNAGWDEEMLKLEVAELKGFDFNLELMGFDLKELDSLLQPESEGGLTGDDDVPPVPEVPTTRAGDVWVLGEHRVMCGDSTNTEQVQILMDDKNADMGFTDPPYGVDYEGITNDDRGGLKNLLDGAFSNYLNFSKSGASIYVFHSDRCADVFHEVFRKYFHFSSMVIWVKNSLTLSRTDYQSQHEPCLYGWMDNGTQSWMGDRKQTSIWKFDKERIEGHTTPKPVALIERALSNSSKSGDVILDLFGGSGSTIIACHKVKRHCYMMELEPKYVDVIVSRWEDFTGEKATLLETGKSFEEMRDERGE